MRESRTERARRLSLAAATVALLGVLGGCRVGPNYQKVTAPTPPAFKEGGASSVTVPPKDGDWKQATPADAAIKGNWWEVFNDSQLNGLEEKVAGENFSLKAASQRYEAALQQVKIARSSYYPTVSLEPNGNRNKWSSRRPNRPTTAKNYFTDLQAVGQASWEPDLWGKIRRTVTQSRANLQASAADLANAKLSLQAELAMDYFEMRGLDLQTRLLKATVKDYKGAYELASRRFKGGVSTENDVALAQTQLLTTQSQLVDVQVARANYEHAIASLIGQPASTFSLSESPLDQSLPHLPVGVPSQLLERRPDIAAAERSAAAANEQIGINAAAYYPDLTIGLLGGVESYHGGTLFNGSSSLWTLGASASQILFDAGRRKAMTQQARLEYDATVSDYRQSVLDAIQEVEDNLSTLRVLEAEAVTEQSAIASAQRSLDISTNRYKGGVVTYLDVLTAENARLQNQRQAADIVTRQFSASVALIRALGGGWDSTQLPTTP